MDNVEPELAASVPPRASYTWEESPEGLVVTFPSPPAEARSVGCAMAILVAALLVFLALAILLAAVLSEDPANTRLWLPAAALLVVSTILFPYLSRGVREARLPPPAIVPSVLTVRDQRLAIDRTGEARDTDVSWELGEIADLRICPAAQVPLALGIGSLLAKACEMDANGLLRISVMQPSGKVDDVLLRVPGCDWAAELEERLRRFLNLPEPPRREEEQAAPPE